VLWAVAMLAGCASGLAPADTGDAGQELLGIGLSPNGPIARVGEQLAFTAKAFYADTTNEVINDQVTWVVTEPRVAEIDASGVATVLAAGVTDIVVATPSGDSARVQLTAKSSDISPTGIALSPATLALTVGEVIEVEAIAEFSDGSAGNVSARCAFTSDAPGVVAMSGPEARGVAAGDTTVRADCDGLQASATAHVTAAGTGGRPDLRVTDLVLGILGVVPPVVGPRALAEVAVDVFGPPTILSQHDGARLEAILGERCRQAVEVREHRFVILGEHRRDRIELGREVE